MVNNAADRCQFPHNKHAAVLCPTIESAYRPTRFGGVSTFFERRGGSRFGGCVFIIFLVVIAEIIVGSYNLRA
jgi:hypothetical protein